MTTVVRLLTLATVKTVMVCLCMIDETGNDSAKCMLLGGLLEAKNLELMNSR